MIPKRLLALTLFAALAVMPTATIHAQWVRLGTPGGGLISSFAGDTNYIFAGVAGGGIYRESAGKLGWVCVNTGLANLFVHCLIFSDGILYAGTDNGVSVSSDEGESWSILNNGLPANTIVNFFEVMGNTLVAGSTRGIYTLPGNGNNWVTSIGGNGSVTGFATIGTELFASMWNYIIRSNDRGVTWSPVADSGLFETQNIALGAIGNILILTEYSDSGTPSYWRSTDSGTSWVGYNGYVFSFAALGDKLFGGGGYVSNDSGLDWIVSDSGLPGSEMDALGAINGNLYEGTSSGVYSSTDSGTSWHPLSSDFCFFDVISITCIGSKLIASTGNFYSLDSIGRGEVFLSTDSGLTWSIPDSSFGYVMAFATKDTNLFAGSYEKGVFLSTDVGSSWVAEDTQITQYIGWACSFLQNGNNLFVGGNSGIFLTPDGGNSWMEKNNGLPSNPFVDCLAQIGNYMFVGTDGIFRSTDSGSTWSAANDGLIKINNNEINALAACGSNLFASETGTNGIEKLYRSTDSGENWISIENFSVDWLAASGKNLFAGYYFDGILLSTDAGSSWENVSEGLTDSSINCLMISGDYLYVGTAEDGVWRRPLAEIIPAPSIITEAQPVSGAIKIYPNPLSQSTSITFTLPEASEVTLTISDALGCETPLLRSAWMDASQHEITWDASNYPSGVYLCRLNAGGESVTQRVVVLK